uniref:Thioredoxin domain-containing protein n=1 Tax=Gadus morhua TaxID=8049 RepID=A0A8C5B2S8_GADMO
NVTFEEFQAALAEAGDNLVVVDFTASWCGPCKVIGPKFVVKNRNVVFLKVDVDEAADVAAHYEVNCMPTFLFFKNGEKVRICYLRSRAPMALGLECFRPHPPWFTYYFPYTSTWWCDSCVHH